MAERFGGEEADTMTYYNRLQEAIVTGDRHVYLTRKLLNFQEFCGLTTIVVRNILHTGGPDSQFAQSRTTLGYLT